MIRMEGEFIEIGNFGLNGNWGTFTRFGGIPNLVIRQDNVVAVHIILKIHDDADWTWRGNVTLRQAASEARGESKEEFQRLVANHHGNQ